ncbi:DMT family transporter [Ligilactobacillus ceti]|uniref:DMT family permease n=1 Tax=Ligilactobacillus ceti DSM 22408 TaxID=1122146 RepID=A0A0R2KS50_9LACO|nr:DMT family transporter [Ligilactobacillus ceti]KRN88989.1 DMT family permease [Ligilactobacillus ceti DSM 22408]
MKNSKEGIFFAILGTMLWGISGNFAQYLFTRYQYSAFWVVGVRLIVAGFIILVWSYIAVSRKEWRRFWHKENIMQVLAFTFLGMVPSQLTYFCAIEWGNASTATVLQFMGPLFIIIYLALRSRQLPRRVDIISIIIAIVGTVLLVTNGNLASLSLAPLALFWGIMAGVSQASYTLLPRKLLQEFDARLVTGAAMVVGGLTFLPIVITQPMPQITPMSLLSLGYIIIFGTMFAYLFYLKSLQTISPATTGMLSAFEPLTATFVAMIWMQLQMSPIEILGAVLILSTAFIQALSLQTQSMNQKINYQVTKTEHKFSLQRKMKGELKNE